MPDWKPELRRRLGALGLSPAREAEIIDEMAQHLDDREAELRRSGLGAAEARQAAQDELADDDRLRQELARLALRPPPELPPPGTATGRLVDRVRQDLRYAARTLRKQPGFSAAAILALAIGIGATSAIFGAVDAVLLRPMPFPHADRLYVPVSVNAARKIDQGSVTFADYIDWRAQKDIFAEVALWRPINVDLSGDGSPERALIAQVSEEFFRLIDVRPDHGRTFVPNDHEAKTPSVTVISHGLWQRRFGGTPDTVGKKIRISGQPFEIIGILPAAAVWPDNAALFVPMRPANFNEDVRTRRDNQIFESLARLNDGVTAGGANAKLSGMAARLEQANPVIRKGWTNRVLPLREFIVDANLKLGLLVLLGAVTAVLLIACANVANLALVRGSSRARELALRMSLGASRPRLIQQLIVESLVLTACGAAAGIALSALIMKGLVLIARDDTPFVEGIGVNPRVLAATILVSAIAALVSGLVPALSNSSVRMGSALREGSTGTGSSRRANRLRNTLVVGEVAASVVLLASAALLIRSFDRLSHVDPGVSLDRVITARISVPGARYPDSARRAKFVQDLVDRIAAAPDVESAAATSFVPAGGGGFGLGRVFLFEGQPEPPATADTPGQWNVITPDYFRTLGIRVVEGRPFDSRDAAKATPVIIVTRQFARQMFPNGSAIGRRVRSWRDENVYREIVGVVDDVKYEGLADRDSRLVYVPHAQDSWGALLIAARSKTAQPEGLGPELRRAVAALDPELAVAEVRTLRESAQRSIATERYATLLLSVLAGVALLLSALGVYGVTSYVFTLRRREMGIRLALGASRANLYGLVLQHGLGLAALGLVIGGAAAAGATVLLKQLLFETAPNDAAAWTGMATAVAIATLIACLLPARKAAAADPTRALRAE